MIKASLLVSQVRYKWELLRNTKEHRNPPWFYIEESKRLSIDNDNLGDGEFFSFA